MLNLIFLILVKDSESGIPKLLIKFFKINYLKYKTQFYEIFPTFAALLKDQFKIIESLSKRLRNSIVTT